MERTKRNAEAASLPEYHCRWYLKRDLPQVLAIEEASFSSPWNEDEFNRWNRKRDVMTVVVECQREIVAFQMYQAQKHRYEILDMAVKPDSRRLGIGRYLIGRLAEKLAISKRQRICILVAESALS